MFEIGVFQEIDFGVTQSQYGCQKTEKKF